LTYYILDVIITLAKALNRMKLIWSRKRDMLVTYLFFIYTKKSSWSGCSL